VITLLLKVGTEEWSDAIWTNGRGGEVGGIQSLKNAAVDRMNLLNRDSSIRHSSKPTNHSAADCRVSSQGKTPYRHDSNCFHAAP
jgi:hypothetical protein